MTQVLVTGATGRTGSLVLNKLQDLEHINAVGFARSPDKVTTLFGSTDHFHFGTIGDRNSLTPALKGCDVLVILTSAQPQVTPPTSPGSPPGCTFEAGGTPEEVDYQGQLHQIDAAKAAGIQHIILVGSMGGTNEQHPLNTFGKILIWKRKSEQYLIESGLDYTIIRAGGLIDEPGDQRALIVGKNDQLLQTPPNGIATTIPRADVAKVVIQAIAYPEARNKAFDVIAMPPSDPPAPQDFADLFAQTTPGL